MRIGRRGSLRVRLFLILLAVGIVPLLAVGSILVYSSGQNRIDSLLTELQYQSVALVGEL